jgi:hypothetical protein
MISEKKTIADVEGAPGEDVKFVPYNTQTK